MNTKQSQQMAELIHKLELEAAGDSEQLVYYNSEVARKALKDNTEGLELIREICMIRLTSREAEWFAENPHMWLGCYSEPNPVREDAIRANALLCRDTLAKRIRKDPSVIRWSILLKYASKADVATILEWIKDSEEYYDLREQIERTTNDENN